MYIGNFEQDNLEMQEESQCKVVFTYPSTPKLVPLTNAVRKGNSIAFFFRAPPDREGLEKLVKLANSDFVNPAPQIARVHMQVYKKVNDCWEDFKYD